MKTLFLPTLLGSTLLAAPAYAQRAFQVGPTGGLTLATARFAETSPVNREQAMPLRAGFLVGATANWQSQGHWGGRLATLFVQQGYTQRYTYPMAGQSIEQVRLNYLRLPLQATFSQHAGGQGFQIFAGPYAGVLLGGHHSFESTYQQGSFVRSGRVVAADTHTASYPVLYSSFRATIQVPNDDYYARRFDVGVQGGLGYRLGNALLQVNYTLGLRNLATTTLYELGGSTISYANTPYRTRGLEASLTYLLGPAH
jgi:hypothetical protein